MHHIAADDEINANKDFKSIFAHAPLSSNIPFKPKKGSLEAELSELIFTALSVQQGEGKVIRFHGIIDTGAQLPVLSINFCKRNNIETIPIESANLRPTYFDGITQLPALQTNTLTVRYMPGIVTESVFLVLPSSTPANDCLIGGKLLQRLAITDFTHTETDWAPDTLRLVKIGSIPVTTISSKQTNTGHLDFPDDDMILDNWTELNPKNPYDLPLSYSGSEPTRQHVVDHLNSVEDEAQINARLPPILEALNHNNANTGPPNFIDDPDATIQLRHVPGTEPKYVPQARNMAERKKEAIRAQIIKWHAGKKIREILPHEKKRWNSQLLTAPKPGSFETDGTQRLRTVFNGSNTVNLGLICDKTQGPTIQDILAKCKGASFFTELDCEDAYMQLILDAESQLITAFEFEGKSWCFVGAPYGVTFIGNTFQRVMQKYLLTCHSS